MKGRIDYYTARTLTFISLGYCLTGPLARYLGITSPKVEYLDFLLVFDTAMISVLLLSIAYIVYAVIYNARLSLRN
jgi:hypothetical protein